MAKALQTDDQAPLQVGVRELREHLSRYLAQVSEGRAIVVTDRGRPVAKLLGVDQMPRGLQALVEEGLVILPDEPATGIDASTLVKARGSVADLVGEQRR